MVAKTRVLDTKKRATLWKSPPLVVQCGLLFLLCLGVLGLASQVPFTFKVELGKPSGEWAIVKGFGDPEQNEFFSFRWTTGTQAELLVPDVGWPNRLNLEVLAPRPDNSIPEVTFTSDKASTVAVSPEKASQLPAKDGRLTFELPGYHPHLDLNLLSFTINSDTFQPKGDPRSLGIIVTELSLTPDAGSWVVVVPPLTLWFGSALFLTLLYYDLRKTLQKMWLSFVIVGIFLTLLVVLRLAYPQWFVQNMPGISWGILLPLCILTLPKRFQSVALLGVVAVGLLLLYYGLALVGFVLALFVTAGILVVIKYKPLASHISSITLITVLTFPIGWRFWLGRLPRATDLYQFHIYWINELDRLIKAGNLYPRWTPDFTWGQGWTVFNYYPPTARYFPEFWHLLGMSFNNGLLLAAFMALMLGAIGCYFWCFEILNNRAPAILGALAFSYLPYRTLDMFAIGELANYMGGAVIPWIVWLVTRLIRRGNGAIRLGVAGATLAVTSTPQLLVFLPVITLYTVLLIIIEWPKLRPKLKVVALKLGMAAALAVGLSAFFLFPATFELGKVTLKFARADLSDNSRFWSSITGVFDLWHPINNYIANALTGLIGTLYLWLAVIGVVVMVVQRPSLRRMLGVLAVVSVVTILLQLPISRIFWEIFSALTTVQFSSRLMYSAVVFMAPLIGGIALIRVKWKADYIKIGSMVAVYALLLVGSYYQVDLAYWPTSFEGEISTKALTEQVGNGDVMYLPKGVGSVEEISKYFDPVFGDGRVSSETDNLKWSPTGSDSYLLEANNSQAATIILPIFWSEGLWKITDQNGREYTSSPAPNTQHLSLELPSGSFALQIKLQDNLLKVISNWLSLITFLGLAIYFCTRFLFPKKGS